MKRIVPIVLACFCVPCRGEDKVTDPGTKPFAAPSFEKRESPATLIKKNPDGTLLVSLKPQIYLDELGCVMLSDREGHTFSQLHHIISFSLEKTRYWTIWGTSPGSGPPVKLDPATDYKCLIKTSNPPQEGAATQFSIQKIWEGDKLIFECKEKTEQGTDPKRPLPPSEKSTSPVRGSED